MFPMTGSELQRLPALLDAWDGHGEWDPPVGLDAGLLLRDTSLPSLLRHSGHPYPVAVDLDTVEGLADDDSGLHFLIVELGYRIVMTRHHEAACRLADLGALALMRVSALDSSGLERSLESHPRRPGMGTVLSPGLVLPHLPESKRVLLPRPLVAYGLLTAPEDVAVCLALADSVVVRRELLAALAERGRPD
jgi:glycerol-3-phosphate responsive antiterminator